MATLKFTAQASQLIDSAGNSLGTNNSPLYTRGGAGQSGAFGAIRTVEERLRVHAQFVYSNNAEQVKSTTANGGTTSNSTSMAIIGSGTNSAGSAILETIAAASYEPSQGVVTRFSSLFSAGVASNVRIIGFMDANDGFGFGYNGIEFGIIHRQAGVDTWIPQSSWNGTDTLDGSGDSSVELDPSKGNVFIIDLQYLGFGAITFSIENPATGFPILVHTLEYPNSAIRPHIDQATLPVYAQSINSGSTTNCTISCGSWGIATEGPSPAREVRGAVANRITGLAGTRLPVVSLKNSTSFKSKTNRIRLLITSVAFSQGGGKDAQFYLVKNPVLTNDSFADFHADTSVAKIDIAANAIDTAGRDIQAFPSDGGETTVVDLTAQGIRLNPGDIMTVEAVNVGAGGSVNPQAAINWVEEF